MATEGSSPRRFLFRRDEDASGVSGTGYVAEGVQFTDGRVALRWRTEHASVAVYDSIEDVEYIHGHNGKTSIVWIDPVTPQPDPQINIPFSDLDIDKYLKYVSKRVHKLVLDEFSTWGK